MNRPEPESLAIVVALTDPATPAVVASLARFAAEVGTSGEVVLVDASGTSASLDLARRLDNIRVIPRTVGSLAPVLWRDGLLATNATLVAFTTAQMVPSPGWLAALRSRLTQAGAAGVGGPIEPGRNLSAIDQAVALLRYSQYFPGFVRSSRSGCHGFGTPTPCDMDNAQRHGFGVPNPWHQPPIQQDLQEVDPPGDNSLYRRDRLMVVKSSWVDGFWEVEVHKALRKQGDTLAMADAAVVTFEGGVGLLSMARRRVRHARKYGSDRSKDLGKVARLARIAASPLIPPLLCLRIVKALRSRRMALVPWLAALPCLMVLASAWAFGEALGMRQGDPISPDDQNRELVTQLT